MDLNSKAIGHKMKMARKRRGLTQQDLAERIDCSPTYVSYIESGIKGMSLGTFVMIANSLNVSADELLVDVLENTIRVSNHSFADLLADCTEYERRVLQDILTATKTSLRINRGCLG